MKSLFGLVVAICCACCVPAAKATDCHANVRQQIVVREYAYAAPLVEYQIVTPHQQFVEEVREYVHVQPQRQRVRVVQKNVVQRPVVVRERVRVEKVQVDHHRNFSRQRIVTRGSY